MKVKSLPIGQVKAGPEDGLKEGEFLVYPSTFTREPDAYGDVVAKGAFLDDIAAWKDSGNVLPGLYGHRMDDPDYFVAGAIEEGEDEHGWWVKGEFDLENPKAQQVYRLVKGRRLNQLSFAYDTLEEGKVDLGEGKSANELRKLKRYEFSFVPLGANQDTSVVAVKGIVDSLTADRSLTAKNRDALLEARAAIDSVLSASADGDEKAAPAADPNQEKASGDAEAKSGASDEEPEGAKSSASDEEPKSNPSARALVTVSNFYALTGAERGSS
jgi:uncharacterized protein